MQKADMAKAERLREMSGVEHPEMYEMRKMLRDLSRL